MFIPIKSINILVFLCLKTQNDYKAFLFKGTGTVDRQTAGENTNGHKEVR